MSARMRSELPRAALLLLLLVSCLGLLSCATPAPTGRSDCDITPPRLEWWEVAGGVCLSPQATAELTNYINDIRRCVRQ